MTWDPRQQTHPSGTEPPAVPPLPSTGFPPDAYPTYTLAYHQPVAVPRPTAVTVLAIIGIVLSTLWMLMGLGSGFSLVVLFSFMGSGFPMQLPGFRAVMIWTVVSGAVGGLIGVTLLVACIGCLRMRPWGRDWMIRYAIADLAWIAIKFVITVAWVLPTQRAWATIPLPAPATAPAPPPATPAPTTSSASPSARTMVTPTRTPLAAVYYTGLGPDDPVLQTVLFTILAGIYPLAVLYYMTRPRIKGAFTPVSPADRAG